MCWSSFSSLGAATTMLGITRMYDDVEDALVRLAVVADESGPVDADGHPKFWRATSWISWSKARWRKVE